MAKRPRKALKPEDLMVWTDTREQKPLDLNPLRWERMTLATGDYTLRGLESIVSVERKSLEDLVGCVGKDRERFEREVQRLLAFESRLIVVEATWKDLESGLWRGRVTAEAVVGSVMGWIERGIPIDLVGNHERAGKHVARFLYTCARRRWRQLQGMDETLRTVGQVDEKWFNGSLSEADAAWRSPGGRVG